MKLLFLVGDGMGDRPLAELGGKTPLEAADTPNMDALAAAGIVGRAQTIPQDMEPGSDVANMALVGFDPAAYHTGRGPIEAAAMGLDLGPDDLAWRLNLVNVTEFAPGGLMRDYSAGHITTPESRELIARLKPAVDSDVLELFPGVQYRHILVQRNGAGTPEEKLAVNPPHDITDKPLTADHDAYRSSPLLSGAMDAAVEVLAAPNNATRANCIWPWGQGKPLTLPDFAVAYGMRGAVVTAVDLVRGLGRAASMEVIDVPGATGLLDTNYRGKVDATLDFLERGDFVYVHLEGPDECGHAGDAKDKIEAIHRFDTLVVGPVVQALRGRDAAFIVTCDHYTPIEVRTHTREPVPFILAGPNIEPDERTRLTERQAEGSPLLVDPGHQLLARALERFKG